MTDEEKLAERYVNEIPIFAEEGEGFSRTQMQGAFLAGLKAGKDEWHKLDWEKDYPEVDRLVRVRTKYNETEYICRTYLYIPAEDEIGYGTTITQFEQLNGDWVDDTWIKYWCYIEPFNFKE